MRWFSKQICLSSNLTDKNNTSEEKIFLFTEKKKIKKTTMMGKRSCSKQQMSSKSISKTMKYREYIDQDKKEEAMRIHAQSLQDLCHTKKETRFLLTNGNSKISKEDSMSSFVKISHLYGTSYCSTCKNHVPIRLPLATLEMAT